MADAIERALAELDRCLSRLEPQARKELLSEAAHHLEDLRTAHSGDAEAAVQEFGDPRKLSVPMLRAFGPRRSRALAALTFMGPMVLVAGSVANGYGGPWEFVWFFPPLLVAFGCVAYLTRRFAWREIGLGALAGAFASWVFLAAATIDVGEKDGYSIMYAPTALRWMQRNERVQDNGKVWLARLLEMERAYAKGDPIAAERFHKSRGFLVPDGYGFAQVLVDTGMEGDFPTKRVPSLSQAVAEWHTAGESLLNATRQATLDAQRGMVEYPGTMPSLSARFVPQLGGYLPTAAQVAAFAFGIGAGIHLLMLGLRFVAEALWRRLRPEVAA